MAWWAFLFNQQTNPGRAFFKSNRQYIDLAKPKSGAPGFFILTGCMVSENKKFSNCPRFGVSGYCLIKSFLPFLLYSKLVFPPRQKKTFA